MQMIGRVLVICGWAALTSAMAAAAPLDAAHDAFRDGKMLAARQALAALDVAKLPPAQVHRYWRLRLELDLETARYADAVTAGLACRKHFDALRFVDHTELGTLAIQLARAYEKQGQADAAEKQLNWALARWPRAADRALQARQRADPQGRIELTRLRVATELARLQMPRANQNALTLEQAKPHWDPIIADARKWLSNHAGGASLESLKHGVEILIEGLLVTGQRQAGVEAVDKLAAQPVSLSDTFDRAGWMALLARQYLRLGAAQAAPMSEQAMAAVARIKPPDAARLEQCERLTADLAFDAAQSYHHLKKTEREAELARLASEKYVRLEAATTDVRDRQHYLSRLMQLAALSGNLNEAVEFGRRWIAVQEVELDPLDPRRLLTRLAVASLCVAAHDPDEVTELVRDEDLDYFRQRKPLDARNWGSALLVLSQAETHRRQYAAARSRLEREQTVWNHHLPSADLLRIKLEAQLAELLIVQGDYRRAIPLLTQLRIALEDMEESAPGGAERQLLLPQVLLSLALAHDAQGHFEEALPLCRLAHDERIKTTSADAGEMLPFHLALCRMSLHQLIEATEKREQELQRLLADARQHTDQAFKIVEAGQPDTMSMAQVLYHRGLLHDFEKNVPAALDDWQRALEIARSASDGAILSCRIQVQLGRTLAEQLRLEEADRHLSEATQYLEQLGILPGLWYAALCTRAQVLLTLDRKDPARAKATSASAREDLALECLKQAVQLMEFPRAASTNGEVARAQYFARYAMAYDLLVDLLAVRFDRTESTEDYEQALYYSDRSRNRTLLDQLASTENQVIQSLEPAAKDLLDNRTRLLQECLDWESRLLALQHQPSDVDGLSKSELDAKKEELKERLSERRGEYAKCHAGLQDLVRQRAGVAAAYPACDVDEWRDVLGRLFQSGSAALLYHASPHGSHLFLRTDKVRRHWRLRALVEDQPSSAGGNGTPTRRTNVPLTAAQLANLVDGYRRIVSDRENPDALLCDPSRSASPAEARTGEQLQEYGHAVAQAILPRACRQELEQLRKDKRVLIVVPDGPLQRLPLESLILERGSPPVFAVERLPAIVYTPSLMTLERLLAHRQRREGAAAPMLIALGLVDFAHWGKGNLENATNEAQAIAKVFAQSHPTGQAKELLLAQASEGGLRSALSSQPCTHLHLAAHAEVDQESEGLFGRILLSPPMGRSVPDDDGALHAYEVPSLPLGSCELVFLSGCSTNVGPAVPLECASSLLRAFLSAGACRVLGSHWSVDDASTALLMESFVKEVWSDERSQAPDYAVALQKARDEIRGNDKYRAPFYWAPFVLYGPGQ